MDELDFVETHHRLRQGIVVAAAARANRAHSAGLGQALGVANGEVLHAPGGEVDLSVPGLGDRLAARK